MGETRCLLTESGPDVLITSCRSRASAGLRAGAGAPPRSEMCDVPATFVTQINHYRYGAEDQWAVKRADRWTQLLRAET